MKILFSNSRIEGVLQNIVFATSRVAVGLMMAFGHGINKVPPSEKFIGFLMSMSFPMPTLLAWGAGLSEFLFSIFLALGFMTRISSTLLLITMSVAAFIVHGNDPFSKQEPAMLYFFVYLVFFSIGGGKFSLDHIIQKK